MPRYIHLFFAALLYGLGGVGLHSPVDVDDDGPLLILAPFNHSPTLPPTDRPTDRDGPTVFRGFALARRVHCKVYRP